MVEVTSKVSKVVALFGPDRQRVLHGPLSGLLWALGIFESIYTRPMHGGLLPGARYAKNVHRTEHARIRAAMNHGLRSEAEYQGLYLE